MNLKQDPLRLSIVMLLLVSLTFIQLEINIKDLFELENSENRADNSKSNNKYNLPFSGFVKNEGQHPNLDLKYYFTSSSSSIGFTKSKTLKW